MNFNKDEERVPFSIHKRLFLPYGIIFVVSFEREGDEASILPEAQP
jgi:hypothetical protein